MQGKDDSPAERSNAPPRCVSRSDGRGFLSSGRGVSGYKGSAAPVKMRADSGM